MADLDRCRAILSENQSPDRVRRMWRAVENEIAPRERTRVGWRWAVALTAVVAAVLVAVTFPFVPTDGPLTLEEGRPVPRQILSEQTTVNRFSDGSSVVVDPGGAMTLVENSGRAVGFILEQGRVRFDVVPGGPRTWWLHCGEVLVTVLGTSFVCEKSEQMVTVSVERGVVAVTGRSIEGGRRNLTAGESVQVKIKDLLVKPSPLVSPGPEAPKGERVKMIEPVAIGAEAKTDAGSAWKEHARAGDYKEAFNQLGSSGVATLARKTKDVDELFELSDVARQSGHPLDAIAPLETIVEDFKENPRAGLAAYTLGRLYLEQLSSPRKAVRMFELALASGLPEALEEVASVKMIRALLLQRDTRGRKLASEYLMMYPEGRYRGQVESWLKD